MIFFPYRLDVSLSTIPVLTILVCLICLLTFLSQKESSVDFEKNLASYCTQRLDPNLHAMLDRIDDDKIDRGCENVFMGLRRSSDHDQVISALAAEVANLDFYADKAQDLKYKEGALKAGFADFEAQVPSQLTERLAYRPDRYNVITMITSTFAHASWEHLLGNLFFFFIFASCVECVLGVVHFSLCFVLMAIATSLAYSVSAADAMPTIGLSGVAMGMMALLTTLLPHAGIRCFFWFLLYVRRFTLPVIVIAIWHIGWNVYDLHNDPSSDINYMAHVSGAITGIVLGILYRTLSPRRLEAAMVETNA